MTTSGEQMPPNPEMHEPPIVRQYTALKAMIMNDRDQILLLEEAGSGSYAEGTNAGMLQLPGGRVEMGEDPNEGLIREVNQETGLIITPIKLIGMDHWTPTIPNIGRVQIIGIFVYAILSSKSRNAEVQLSNEHHAAQWASSREISKLDGEGRIITPDNKIIKKFLRPRHR